MWIFYGASMLALIVLRYREPKLPRPYKVNHHMLIAHVNLLPVSSHLLNWVTKIFSSMEKYLQCPIVIPVVMLLISVYLVVAPIVDNPQIEYLYSIIFMLAGSASNDP